MPLAIVYSMRKISCIVLLLCITLFTSCFLPGNIPPRRSGFTIFHSGNKVKTDFTKAKEKGQLYLHLSQPHVNSFDLLPVGESRKTNTGFMGISSGLDFVHSKNQYITLSASGVTDFMLPFPAPVDFSGEREFFSSVYAALSHNHKLNRFSLGYGISFVKKSMGIQVLRMA